MDIIDRMDKRANIYSTPIKIWRGGPALEKPISNLVVKLVR